MLLKEAADSYLHKMIKSYECSDHLMGVYVAFKGLAMDIDLIKPDRVTGLCPFMTAATSIDRSLDFVYEIAMMTDPIVMKKHEALRRGTKRGREDEDS